MRGFLSPASGGHLISSSPRHAPPPRFSYACVVLQWIWLHSLLLQVSVRSRHRNSLVNSFALPVPSAPAASKGPVNPAVSTANSHKQPEATQHSALPVQKQGGESLLWQSPFPYRCFQP
ncbi:mCG1039541, isoform CRA_a [Mus musculus]|nr:mCG1039541, isoform CRA_a [Mus musculus]EDL38409.1 mCG1039541, isoform CRA_a [Mus musculus]